MIHQYSIFRWFNISKPHRLVYLSLYVFQMQDAHESDSDKDCNDEDNLGQYVRKTPNETETEPKASSDRERALNTSEKDPPQSHIIDVVTDGTGCNEQQDSDPKRLAEKEHLRKLRVGFTRSCLYPPGITRHFQDVSMANSLFHSSQVNTGTTWYGYANVDGAGPCGLSPGTSGFPMSLQQHALVQVHRGLTSHY